MNNNASTSLRVKASLLSLKDDLLGLEADTGHVRFHFGAHLRRRLQSNQADQNKKLEQLVGEPAFRFFVEGELREKTEREPRLQQQHEANHSITSNFFLDSNTEQEQRDALHELVHETLTTHAKRLRFPCIWKCPHIRDLYEK
jgi:hypothetical protein